MQDLSIVFESLFYRGCRTDKFETMIITVRYLHIADKTWHNTFGKIRLDIRLAPEDRSFRTK